MEAVAAALVVGSALWRSPGTRVRGVLVVPFVVGLASVTLLAVIFADETLTFLRNVGDTATGLLVATLVILVGLIIADFLVARAARFVAGARSVRNRAHGVDAACVLTLTVAAMVGFVGLVELDHHSLSSYELLQLERAVGAQVAAEHELPGQPMDIALRSSSEGYISLLGGRIARFVLTNRDEIEFSIVASHLESPRGLSVAGDSLVVAELGRLPCRPQFPCKGEDVGGVSSTLEGERKILRESNARLVRFDIRPDGTLANPRTILDQLPVANSEHAVNAVTTGVDGRVYVTVGNLDRLATTPLRSLDQSRPNVDVLGTVLSLRPDGTDLRVVARGLRNVYDLAFDDGGRLYGVDNDGETRTGWRREEVLEIRQGGYYGYPFDGTFAPNTRRTAFPLWVLETVGSAGVEWIRWNRTPTLVVGSCGNVDALTLAVADGTLTVNEQAPVRRVLSGLPGCVTAIERIQGQRLLVSLFTYRGPPRLYVVRPG
jgi:hypothetical protein